MTYEPAADRMDISRLANEALALAARLPGHPSRVKMRSGTCEIEIEWPTGHDQAAEPDHGESAGETVHTEERGRHRRPGDDEGRAPSFSIVSG